MLQVWYVLVLSGRCLVHSWAVYIWAADVSIYHLRKRASRIIGWKIGARPWKLYNKSLSVVVEQINLAITRFQSDETMVWTVHFFKDQDSIWCHTQWRKWFVSCAVFSKLDEYRKLVVFKYFHFIACIWQEETTRTNHYYGAPKDNQSHQLKKDCSPKLLSI